MLRSVSLFVLVFLVGIELWGLDGCVADVLVDVDGDGQSRLEYWIECREQQKQDCGICQAAPFGPIALDGLSLGTASVVVAGTCALVGC